VQATLHQATPAELLERNRVARTGSAFLVMRDGEGLQVVFPLDPARAPFTLGRSREADILLAWDREVSRVHAELERVGGQWALSDNGLSRNGTFVNEERLKTRRRLADKDTITVGATKILFRSPGADDRPQTSMSTIGSAGGGVGPELSEAQRRVAIALCRPFAEDAMFPSPASNKQIADELFISIPTVKTHLRSLFACFGIEGLPQNEKRRRLVELLLIQRVVHEHQLREP
jgi:hypothetical protein